MDESLNEKTAKARRLVKNSIWLFAAEALAKVIALLTQVLAARYLGGEGFGVFSFAFAGTGAFIVFIDTGLGVYLTREVSRRPESAPLYLRKVLTLKFRLSLITALVLTVAFFMASLQYESLLAAVAIGLALMVNGYTDMYLSVLRAFERMALVSVLMVGQRILFFILGMAVLLQGGDVVVFSSAFLAASLLILLIARGKMAAGQLPASAEDGDLARRIFQGSLPICGMILFTYVYFRIDAVMLFFLRGELETGWYSAAFKLMETLALLMASVRAALFPVLSKAFGGRGDPHRRIWQEAVRYFFLASVPVAVGTALLAPGIVSLLYGPQYESAAQVLRIMAMGFPLMCVNDLASYLLLSQNRTRGVLLVSGGAAVLNVTLNFLLIARWGMSGAALAAVATQLLVFWAFTAMVRNICGKTGIPRLLWRPALAAGGMALLLTGFESLSLIAAVFLSVVLYFAILCGLQTFNAFDRRIFAMVLNR